MNEIIFENERTLASAGSGKTYDLTNRIIALVASGTKPEEICALTFTRKAAAEFFIKTMQKLADASTNQESANKLSKQIKESFPKLKLLNTTDFQDTLEKFAKALPRLNFSTIDSFSSSYLKLFTNELGINENISILDDFSKDKAKEKALFTTLQLFKNDNLTIANFAKEIKEASYNSDQKTIISTINDFVDNAHFNYLLNPNKNCWKAIKPATHTLEWDETEFKSNLRELEEMFGDNKGKKPILTLFKDHQKLPNLGKFTEVIANQFRKTGSSLGAKYEKIVKTKNSEKEVLVAEINEMESTLIDDNIKRLIDFHTKPASKAIAAIYNIVSLYEKIYAENVRKQGLLGFDDITISIAKSKNEIERKFVEYRLDNQTSHWLFDEFQDTSRLQWDIFKNIIDEVLTTPNHEKTFYFVGDIKQSIYGWRGGDMRLFNEIYEENKDYIIDKPQKKTSFRSCPAIIDFVNEIFRDWKKIGTEKDISYLLTAYFGTGATKMWFDKWEDHDVEERNQKKKGCISVDVINANDDEDDAEDTNPVGEAVYNYIKKINPIARKLTCAVLVQTNKKAEQIIDVIRTKVAEEDSENKSNIKVASELDIKIAQDNLAIPVILALLKFAIHPQDTFAKNYIEMSPLKDILNNTNWTEELLEKISSLGFADGLKDIVSNLSKHLQDFDSFTKNRLNQFLEAARNFDTLQNRNIDDFIDFIQKYKIREGAASDTIQVMSIHKSKGLDFDIVILPELENPQGNFSPKFRRRKNGDIVYVPSKTIAQFDKNLKEIYDEFKEQEHFEKLCKFYVALTRAKRAIHIILKKPKTKPQTVLNGNFAHLLLKYFSIYDYPEYTTKLSTENWFEEFAIQNTTLKANNIFSDKKHQSKAYPQIEFDYDFSSQNTANLTGLAVHSIFENLNSNTSLDDAIAAAKPHYLDCQENFDNATKLVKKSLENQEIKEVFNCQDFYVELPYTILNSDEAELGRIDRVNFFDNRTRAEIIDFKTDFASVEELKARHTDQLKRYALALSKSSGIAPQKIALKIISTHNQKLITL